MIYDIWDRDAVTSATGLPCVSSVALACADVNCAIAVLVIWACDATQRAREAEFGGGCAKKHEKKKQAASRHDDADALSNSVICT